MKKHTPDKDLFIGLLLIVVSAVLFVIEPDSFNETNHIFTLLFMIHYSIPIMYLLVIWKQYGRAIFSLFGKQTYRSHLLLLILFNISAFSLNREFTVFYESASWLTFLIVLESVILISLAILKKVPKWLRSVTLFLMPCLLLVHLHQVLIILPLSIYGFLGALFLGIGLLLFVPVFYLVALFVTLNRLKFTLHDTRLMGIGLLVPILSITYYLISWHQIDHGIQSSFLSADSPFTRSDLPDWIQIAKDLDDNFLTEAYLKSKLVYQHYRSFDFFDPAFGRNGYHENAIHDPLISLCMGFEFKPILDEKSRINILKFLYDKRHQTADRFWSGDHLSTDQVVTNVQLFPTERLSYSELILTISNNDQQNRWRPQEEAVYTFQLPEGGVITSLSLWIEGKEEKAILTTKSKAENAYNTIVGRERRDPSVIYWMEGNKARIRVFPCTPKENRKFKVGVTAPLRLKGKRLHYQSISFEGPTFKDARASINIVTNGAEVNAKLPFRVENQFIRWIGTYKPEWDFDIQAPEVASTSFTYKNETYEVIPTPSRFKELAVTQVYLDLSNHWTDDELKMVKSSFESYSIRAIEGPDTPLSSTKAYPNFTLFPYHQLKADEKAIIITKGGAPTPNLEDLKGSTFREDLFGFLQKKEHPVIVLDIGSKPSNYHTSLREFGVINHYLVSLEELAAFARTKRFPDPTPHPDIVDLAANGLSIKRTEEPAMQKGSDHLLRLFYYQAIMNEIGNKYFSSDKQAYLEEELTQLASVANVVTPLSSLIVLETQTDYDRFEIERDKNSLGNASIHNQGAVPEPHEWALIIVGMLMVGWFYFKQYL